MNSQTSPLGNDPLDPHRLTLSNGIQQGDFYIGPLLPPVNATPVQSMNEYLAKRDDNSDSFVTLKILQNQCGKESEVSQGKLLLHNEHLVLSLLQDQPGVVHHQGFFKDRGRFILVLDCLVAHTYNRDGHYKDFVNLQHYVIKKKRLEEKEALELFYNVVSTVRSLHKKNIIHRDLKLGNLVLNTRTREVTLTNFALSKHLVRSNDRLTDQRGSLAYVSPDVLSGRPYDGKASDMWALGVLLYTTLYGQFPFYDNDPQELFRKIKAADYVIPDESAASMRETTLLIRQLIEKDHRQRLTAAQTLDIVYHRLSKLSNQQGSESAQVVPNSTLHSKNEDCMVPDQGDNLSPLNSAPSMDVNTVQLTLSPMLMPFLSNPTVATTTTPGSLPFVPFVLRDFPMQADRPQLLTSSHNPFLGQSSSPPSLYVHTSSSRQHSSSLGGLPPERAAYALMNPLASFPPSSFVCHRYPITMSLSGDSFFHNNDSRPVMMTLDEPLPPSPPVAMTTDSRQPPGQSVMEGLVTIRPSRHSFSSAGVDSIRVHSLSSERLSPQHLLATHSNRRRRNSSGTDRVRRHSSQTITMTTGDGSRRRRRSHDVNDERTELLEGLRMASNRRSSRMQPVPIRIQLSSPEVSSPHSTSTAPPQSQTLSSVSLPSTALSTMAENT